MLKASDVKGLVPEKIDSHLHPVFFQEENKDLNTDKLEHTFGRGFNKCIECQSSKEFYLERENLANVIWVSEKGDSVPVSEQPMVMEQCYRYVDFIIQSFNAGHLLRVKE